MQPSPQPERDEASPRARPRPLRLVVVGSGLESSFHRPDGPTERAADTLARALSLPHRRIGAPEDPQGELQQLDRAAGGWLASLPRDPGQSLGDGGTWAEALGAWRQPTLVIISSQQLASGAAAATTALLRQWRVPILGLLQWGGSWDAGSRRREGLPWLGHLEGGEAPASDGRAEPLAERLVRRWSLLDPPEPCLSGG